MKIKSNSIFYRSFLTITLVLVLFVASGAGYYKDIDYKELVLRSSTTADFGVGANLLNEISFVGSAGSICCIIVILIYLFFRKVKLVPPPIVFVLMFWLYIFVFAAWSADVLNTTILTVKAFVYLLAVVFIVSTLERVEIEKAIILSVALTGIASLYLIFTDDDFARTFTIDGWRGLFGHKNALASYCFYAFAMIAYLYQRSSFKRGMFFSTVLLSILMLGSQGKTAMLVMVFFVAHILICVFSLSSGQKNLGPGIAFSFFISLCLLVGFLLYDADRVASGGEAVSFTGRVDIWDAYFSVFKQHMFFGTGGSIEPESDIMYQIMRDGGAGSAHNAFLQVMVNYGLIGLILFLAIFASAFFQQLEAGNLWQAAVGTGTVLAVLIYSLMESTSAGIVSLPILFLVMQALMHHKEYRKHAAQHQLRLVT